MYFEYLSQSFCKTLKSPYEYFIAEIKVNPLMGFETIFIFTINKEKVTIECEDGKI